MSAFGALGCVGKVKHEFWGVSQVCGDSSKVVGEGFFNIMEAKQVQIE